MLRNLFEEYRFFHQYPDKELHTTAVLFGSIIDQGLVTYVAFCLADLQYADISPLLLTRVLTLSVAVTSSVEA